MDTRDTVGYYLGMRLAWSNQLDCFLNFMAVPRLLRDISARSLPAGNLAAGDINLGVGLEDLPVEAVRCWLRCLDWLQGFLFWQI